VKTAVFHRIWVKKAFIGEKKGCVGVCGLLFLVGGLLFVVCCLLFVVGPWR